MRRPSLSLLAVLLLVGACGPSNAASPSASPTDAASATPASPPTATPTPGASGSAVSVHLVTVLEGLENPLDLDTARDGSGRQFLVEQAGLVRLIADGELVENPYLDISDRITSGGERGLLGIALHPDFPEDPRIFLDYTDLDGNTVVSSFEASLDAEAADPESERIILQVEQPFPNHNGGGLAFGPDGMLYIALGDGGSGGDPLGNGRSLTTHLAKVLRIDIDVDAGQSPAYTIPEDNPWADGADGALPEIWLTGLRNPWRMRFDRATGDLWIGDVGQGAWEEIDVARNGVGGLDYGWNTMEGAHCYEATECDQTGLTLPVTEYGHGQGCAIIGGVVVHDPTVPLIDGRYLFGDECSGNLWTIDPTLDTLQTPVLLQGTGRAISSIAADADGHVLLLDIDQGLMIRIE